MKDELPIEYPFKTGTEKILIVFLLSVVLLLTFGVFPVQYERKDLIARIPETETNASFVIDEVYRKTSDIDLLLLGPCTVWWQIYTPILKEKLSEKYRHSAEVITLGFNHFGSDVMYLILKDLVARRKVKNLLLAVPKIEDLYPFPHQNAVGWWIYPKDLEGVSRLSFIGYSRILGLNLFTSLYRALWPAVQTPGKSIHGEEFGFHSLRSNERISGDQWNLVKKTNDLVHIRQVGALDVNSEVKLSSDWVKFYQMIISLTQQYDINVFFVDSPHAIEFESKSNSKTIPGNFSEAVGRSLPVVSTRFQSWQESLPESLRDKIIAGHNLTVPGAQLFTNLIGQQVVRLTK